MTDILTGLQIDQLKLHVTQMLRRLDALESEVRELRGITQTITPIGPRPYHMEHTYCGPDPDPAAFRDIKLTCNQEVT